MTGSRYDGIMPPSRLDRAVDDAIARDNARPRPPAAPLCGDRGCALPAGHVERAGTPHAPRPWTRCPSCRTSGTPHERDGEECREAALEREISQADE